MKNIYQISYKGITVNVDKENEEKVAKIYGELLKKQKAINNIDENNLINVSEEQIKGIYKRELAERIKIGKQMKKKRNDYNR